MSEARELAEQHNRTFNERAWSRASQIYSPDLVTVEPGAGTIHGIEAFIGFAQGFAQAFPDSRLEVRSITEDGDRVIVEGAYTGTHTGPMASPQGEVPPTGRTLNLPYCDVFEVIAGRIATHRVYYDQMAFAAQLGLLPEAAPAS
jgi:steroid delta-isomerase-like uncharacterized protein